MQAIPSYNKVQKDQEQFLELKKRVYEKVNDLGSERLTWVKVKALIFPIFYFGFYTIALYQYHHIFFFFLLYATMGVTMVFLFLNIIHEASHNVLFKDKSLNSSILYLFDMIGANSYIWKLRHIRLHHNFSNVKGWDSDIQQRGLFKVFPSDERRNFHHYQHLLIFFFYPFYLVNWLFLRDFKDFFSKTQLIHTVCNIPFMEYLKLIIFKLLFLFYTVFIPYFFFGFSLSHTIIALLIMLVTAGTFALIVLLPPHANTENNFPIAGKSKLEHSWLMHQMLTTNDVTSCNWFTKYLMGNFNYHLAHHLFPNISNVYAAEVTTVIKEYAASVNLPYKAFDLSTALKNHYRLIRKNGMDPDFFEDDM